MKTVHFYDYSAEVIGRLGIVEEDGALTQIFKVGTDRLPAHDFVLGETELLKETDRQLREYFSGQRKEFDLPLLLRGTDFQKKVWQALRAIPFGQTASYQEIADRVGSPKACRAVGQANHHNRLSIIVPCHRVIGKSGALTGYGGGMEMKEYLLSLEKRKGAI